MKLLATLAAALLLFTSCNDYDEISFSGTIIDTRECNISYLRPDLGYVVKLDTPDRIGKPYCLNGVNYLIVVILYEPVRTLY